MLAVLQVIAALGLVLGTSMPTKAQQLTTLYSFCPQQTCTHGDYPEAGLVQGSDGNFYGVTAYGGANGISGWGTVFTITPAGALTTLYTFCAEIRCTDGEFPYGGLVQGNDANFYGTASAGGILTVSGGTAFKVSPSGEFIRLYAFCSQINCTDGYFPVGLVQGSDGDFYGTTSGGGDFSGGTVFKITPDGAFTRLYSFDWTHGKLPLAGVVQGSDGNFYGTTWEGGAKRSGTIFRITPSGALTTLYSFCSQAHCTDGAAPRAGLVQGSDGNFYGTAEGGGAGGGGTVFKITPDGAFTRLYSFCSTTNCADGKFPLAALVQGSDGDFYGVTSGGGNFYSGVAFKITPDGAFTKLYTFCSQRGCRDGQSPNALVQGSDGNFYGTTQSGGAHLVGTVFKLSLAP